MQLHLLVLVHVCIVVAFAPLIKHNDLDNRAPTLPTVPESTVTTISAPPVTSSASLPPTTSSPAQILEQCADCQVVGQALAICTSLTPSFTAVPATAQAKCLCYSSTIWSPDVFDNAILNCANFASTAVPTVYGVMSNLEGFCSNVGDVNRPATVFTLGGSATAVITVTPGVYGGLVPAITSISSASSTSPSSAGATIVVVGGISISATAGSVGAGFTISALPGTVTTVAATTIIASAGGAGFTIFGIGGGFGITAGTGGISISEITTSGGGGTTVISGTTITRGSGGSITVSGGVTISGGITVSDGTTISGGLTLTGGQTITASVGSGTTIMTTLSGTTSPISTSTSAGATTWTYNELPPTRTASGTSTGTTRAEVPLGLVVLIGFSIAVLYLFL